MVAHTAANGALGATGSRLEVGVPLARDPPTMPYPARFYAALHRGTPGDVGYYQDVCADAGSVLELGCGYGRMVTALARPGRTVVGVEHDPQLLALAQAAVDLLPESSRTGVELVAGDMRNLALDRRFDRVLIPYCGLYCLLDDADLDAALATVARHLAPHGRVALDVYRADEFHAESEPEDVPEDAHTPLARVEVEGMPYEVLERSQWDKPRQRIDVSYLYVGEDGIGVQGTIEQRYLLETQLRDALARAGLSIVRLADGFVPPPDHGGDTRRPTERGQAESRSEVEAADDPTRATPTADDPTRATHAATPGSDSDGAGEVEDEDVLIVVEAVATEGGE